MNRNKITEFAKASDLKVDLFPHLQVGDLLEFKRAMLQHWAVYVGSIADIHCVIDFVYPDDSNLVNEFCLAFMATATAAGAALPATTSSVGVIRMVPIVSILGDDEVRLNNGFDGSPHQPLDSQVILARAVEKFHAGDRSYDLFRSNCEHFATYCRYGVNVSTQIDELKKKIEND